MQVPVGVGLDRFGSRAMLLSGLVLMTAAQLAFAFVTSFPAAVAARAVLGAGDAMIFTSVLRLVTIWFLVRQAPMVTQLTGQAGQLGAIAAAAPLAYALNTWGWTAAFAAASSVGVVLMVAVALVVKDSPYLRADVVRIKLLALARSVRQVWGNPGTRLGLWSHFVSQFSVTVFSLLWGYPFLVLGQGLSPAQASGLLMVMTGWVVVSGLFLGWLAAWWNRLASPHNSELGMLVYASGFFAVTITMRSLFALSTAILPCVAGLVVGKYVLPVVKRTLIGKPRPVLPPKLRKPPSAQ
jgi:MFS family permease